MTWQLTAGLKNLHSQIDERFPHRDHTSDGTIGDTAHQAETSGHNPDDTAGSKAAWDGDPDSTPEVRAYDMDSDIGEPGVTAQQIVDHIRALPGVAGVLRYMIYNRRMYHSRDGFASTAYDGPSPHTEHIHFEGAWSQAADNNTSFDYRLWEINMPDPSDIATAVWKATFGSQTASDRLAMLPALVTKVDALTTAVAAVMANVKADDGDKAAILADAQTKFAATLAAVGQVDDQVFAKLTDPATPDAQVATALVSLLGARKDAVVALMK